MNPKPEEAQAGPDQAKATEQKTPQKIVVELSLTKLVLKRGDKSFVVPRELFKSLYEAMLMAIQLSDGEVKDIELKQTQTLSQSAQASQHVNNMIPW